MEFRDAARPGEPHSNWSKGNLALNYAFTEAFVLPLTLSFLSILYPKIYSIDGRWGYLIEKIFYIEGISTHLSPRKVHVFKIAAEMPNQMHSMYVEQK